MTRFVLCEVCGSEGRIYTSRGGPDEYDNGPCPECEGTGIALVETEPVTEQELCRVCNAPIDSYELCAECAKGNDPFFTSKFAGDYLRK